MKKMFRNAFYALMVSLTVLLLFRCTKSELSNSEFDLQGELISIENRASQGKIEEIQPSSSISNALYFEELKAIKLNDDEAARETMLKELGKYSAPQRKFIDSDIQENINNISESEKLIYSSLHKILKNNHSNHIKLIEYYVEELSCLKIDDVLKAKVIANISFYKDLLIFINYDAGIFPIKSSNDSKGQMVEDPLRKKWDCPYRDCLDCCMNAKATELANGNVVDWVIFFVTNAALNVTFWVASCSFDCIVQ